MILQGISPEVPYFLKLMNLPPNLQKVFIAILALQRCNSLQLSEHLKIKRSVIGNNIKSLLNRGYCTYVNDYGDGTGGVKVRVCDPSKWIHLNIEPIDPPEITKSIFIDEVGRKSILCEIQ